MKSANYILSLFAAGTAFGASPVVFDDFDTFSSPTGWNLTSFGAPQVDGPETVPSTDETLTASILRTVTVNRTSGSGSMGSNNGSGAFTFAPSSAGTGSVGISYSLSAATDLTVGNAFSFVLVSTDLLAVIDYTISVTDSNNSTSTSTSNLPIILGVFNVGYGSFSGTADFTDITKIELTLTSTAGGSDADIDAFGLNLPPPPNVPEPSTFAAIGFVSLVAFGAYRRNRK